MATIEIGTRCVFSHPTSNGGQVTFSAKVVKVDGDSAWVEMPDRVRRMPFAPLGGKRYGKYPMSALVIKETAHV